MIKDKLIELIENSDLNGFNKTRHKAFINIASAFIDESNKDRELIKNTTSEKDNFEVVISADEFKIYKIYSSDVFYTKYPYKGIYFADDKWRIVTHVSPSVDVALLNILQHKYLSPHEQFADFAIKMLEIELPE